MDYKDTIFLPKTSFEMRANLPLKEPKILEGWAEEEIFNKLVKNLKGRKDLYSMMAHHMQMGIYIWVQH